MDPSTKRNNNKRTTRTTTCSRGDAANNGKVAAISRQLAVINKRVSKAETSLRNSANSRRGSFDRAEYAHYFAELGGPTDPLPDPAVSTAGHIGLKTRVGAMATYTLAAGERAFVIPTPYGESIVTFYKCSIIDTQPTIDPAGAVLAWDGTSTTQLNVPNEYINTPIYSAGTATPVPMLGYDARRSGGDGFGQDDYSGKLLGGEVGIQVNTPLNGIAYVKSLGVDTAPATYGVTRDRHARTRREGNFAALTSRAEEVPLFVSDPDDVINNLNRFCEVSMGASPTATVKKHMRMLVHGSDNFHPFSYSSTTVDLSRSRMTPVNNFLFDVFGCHGVFMIDNVSSTDPVSLTIGAWAGFAMREADPRLASACTEFAPLVPVPRGLIEHHPRAGGHTNTSSGDFVATNTDGRISVRHGGAETLGSTHVKVGVEHKDEKMSRKWSEALLGGLSRITYQLDNNVIEPGLQEVKKEMPNLMRKLWGKLGV